MRGVNMSQYSTTYDILDNMVDAIRYDLYSHPQYLVGDYDNAYVSDLNQLYYDYIKYACETGLYELGESVEDFKNGIESGERYGDIQEVKTYIDFMSQLGSLIVNLRLADESPAKIYDNNQYNDLFRVWINGRKTSLIGDLIIRYESIAKLDDFLNELSTM